MNYRPADPSTNVADKPTIGSALQTALTLALIVHLASMLFGILGTNYVIASNEESAGLEPTQLSSRLERQLAANIPFLGNYRQLLFLNLPYANALTRYDVPDTNHRVEVELRDGRNGDPNSRQVASIVLPPADIEGTVRRHRYEVLANSIANMAGNETAEAVLPTGISEGLLARYAPDGATWLTVRCLGLSPLQTPEQFVAGENPDRPELWRNVYEAQVWKSGEVTRLMKRETARGDNAPVVEASGAATTAPAPGTPASGGTTPTSNDPESKSPASSASGNQQPGNAVPAVPAVPGTDSTIPRAPNSDAQPRP
ncbi:MAG: hypothetical protein K2Y37_04435 [Pirellulales bacterium]|nr:hypothetical protein [Pirellulales bacterium]